MILKLAARFLARNGKNSLLVGLMIMLLTVIFFTGNTLLTASVSGLRRTYVENFTGSIVLHGESSQPLSVFGVVNPAIGEFFTVPVLKDVEQVQAVLDEEPGISRYTHQLTGVSALDVNGRRYETLVFGVDGGSYFDVFDKLELKAGGSLETGVPGAMLSASAAARIETESGNPLKIGDPVMLSSIGSMGFRIREVPLTGIYSFRQNVNTLQDLVFTDSGTARALNSVMIQTDAEIEGDEALLIDPETGIDDLFSDFGDFGDFNDTDEAGQPDLLKQLQTEVSAPQQLSSDGGSWNFILIELAEGASASAVQKRLEAELAPLGIGVMDWRDAAGQAAMIVLILQLIFNAGCILIMIAGIIAIVNIFLISVFRRTGEIGTLRSIGATDGSIRLMLYSENFILTAVSGAVGLLISMILMAAVNSRHIVLNNSIISALLGQSVFSFQPSVGIALTSLLISILMGFIASVYPVGRALKIEPVEAMRSVR